MRLVLATGILFLVSFLPFSSLAADGVIQTVAHGQINWTKSEITATGSGAPNLNAANVAVARLGAERAAKMDAFRNILEAVKGARVTGRSSAESLMAQSPELRNQVQGIVKGFKVVDTKYYSDGGVDVIVTVPLTGVLFDAMVKGVGSQKVAGEPTATSGIVIQAKGLKLRQDRLAAAQKQVRDDARRAWSAKAQDLERCVQRPRAQRNGCIAAVQQWISDDSAVAATDQPGFPTHSTFLHQFCHGHSPSSNSTSSPAYVQLR